MKTILIVDDEISYIKLLKDQLIAMNYNVLSAPDGQKGLEIIKLKKPDLVLLDIKMPVMDGIAMLHLLRKEELIKDTKVIMLTNLEPDSNIIDNAINDHLTYYFVKSDVRIKDLLSKIGEVLNSRY